LGIEKGGIYHCLLGYGRSAVVCESRISDYVLGFGLLDQVVWGF